MLRQAGLLVETSDDGKMAVEMATTRDDDFMLMDVRVLKLGGHDPTRRRDAERCNSSLDDSVG